MLRLALIGLLLLTPATLSAQGLAIGFDPDPFENCATSAESAAAQRLTEERPAAQRAVRIGERTIRLSVAEPRAGAVSGAVATER